MPTVQHRETQPRARSAGKKGADSPDSGLVTLTEAVQMGRLDGLRALRDALAREIVAGRVERGVSQTASLGRQLREVLKEVDELERLNPKKSVVDDLANRRKTRRAAAKGAVEAGGDRQ